MSKYTVEFAESPSQTIRVLQEETTAADGADVVRNALSTYAYAAEQVVENPRLQLTFCRGDEITKIIFIPGVNDTRWRRFKLLVRFHVRRLNAWLAGHWR